MREALIGHTGFVGGNLDRQHAFTDRFHSRNISEMRGGSFHRIVCAGVQAKKWWSNQNPEADWQGIASLLEALETVSCEEFILLSTIDVYPQPSGVDETTEITGPNHVYGAHRLKVEEVVREKFPQALIVRLPGLFGDGLKKNVIFDLLHDNNLAQINPNGVYQYYWLGHLWSDLEKARSHSLPLLNISAEPVPTWEIVDRFFPGKKEQLGAAEEFRASYDMHSAHAGLWGGRDGYLYSRAAVLEEIGAFVRKESSPAS